MQTIAEGREESPSSSIPSSTSLNQQKLQSKVEALSLSNELLKTSLDDAKKQVALLQATVASQREEITTKESQINTINGRVSALLRGMEVSINVLLVITAMNQLITTKLYIIILSVINCV